ncbi:tripartite tricarboxylate transporter permease [Candidatus Woesearchaeota archaeon]|nr:tripartite tricarboxylate transporter permease [Candidatus Woesearchaeota archaeon]
MITEVIIAVFAGIALGTFTGLMPGIHINLLAAIILSASSTLLQHFSPEALAAAIMAMAITHSFLDFIPSIFIGAPSEATALAVLPGHKMLLQGKGCEAATLTAIGGAIGLSAVILTSPLLITLVKIIFEFIKPYTGILLTAIAAYSIVRERGAKAKLWACTLFTLSGILGSLTLGIPNFKEPMLPLLSGLFGISTMLASATTKTQIPKQELSMTRLKWRKILKPATAGAAAGGIMGIFPALGPAQASMLARQLLGKTGTMKYLIMLGAVSTSSMLFGLITLLAIGKARNGSIAIISEIIKVDASGFALLCAAALTAGGMAAIITVQTAKVFARRISGINYRKTSIIAISAITLLTFWLTGAIGIIILATGTAIGIISVTKGIPKHYMMGCLMLPVIIQYL